MPHSETQIDFSVPAILLKWPSRNNQRIRDSEAALPYRILEGTLDECLSHFAAKPVKHQHLYEIHTSPQPTLVTAVLSPEHIAEIARLRDFL